MMQFSGASCLDKFDAHVFRPCHKPYTLVVHNSANYDSIFMLDYCLRHCLRPKVIYTDCKLLNLKIPSLQISLINSLKFVANKLSNRPKMFGLKDVCKMSFPHSFNRPENYDYDGPWPDSSYYDIDSMMSPDKEAFLLKSMRNLRGRDLSFGLNRLSCIADVVPLMKCFNTFRKLMKVEPGVDPVACLTIVPLAMRVFRRNYLAEKWTGSLHPGGPAHTFCKIAGKYYKEIGVDDYDESPTKTVYEAKFVSSPIGVIPPTGYNKNFKHSIVSLEWLYYLEHSEGIEIQHARSAEGEKRVLDNYRADGYCARQNRIFEFYGDVYHGCKDCYPTRRDKTVESLGKSPNQLYEETMRRERKLQEAGYDITTIYECKWDAMKKKVPEIASFVKTLDIQAPLCLQKAMYGGRVGEYPYSTVRVP